MFIFDLHCDTAFEMLDKQKSFINNGLNIDLIKSKSLKNWIQTFAFWINDKYYKNGAYEHFVSQYNYFFEQVKKNNALIEIYDGNIKSNMCNALLSVEGGSVLQGDILKIATLKNMGISFLTLVWNGQNELGSGISGQNGLTEFGKECIPELEKSNIIIDVSHLNSSGFFDVCELATKPIVATHSNAAAVCNHKRNLSDEQLKYIIDNNGLCGINFYPLFVNGKDNCEFTDLLMHIEHILNLGGENILALGSDFDGAAMPKKLNSIEKLEIYMDFMLKYYSEELVQKIMFDNAKKFLDKNLRF